MNKDHVKGTIKEVKGKVKTEIGHAMGDSSTEAEGIVDRVKGKIQQGVGDLKDAVKDKIDSVLDKKKHP